LSETAIEASPNAGSPERHAAGLLKVFLVALRLGLTSFGGPVAHLGYFRDEYVARRKWLDESSFADLVALCQLLPGPASSQLGIAIGTLRAGALGGFLAWLGFTMPSAIALIAFFIGGFVASWSAGISDTGRSLVNGFLVWALWLVAATVLAAVGVGSIAGAMGELFGQVEQPAVDVQVEQLISTVQEGSWQTFLALALTATAAALGGVVGAREELRGAWTRVWTSRIGRDTV